MRKLLLSLGFVFCLVSISYAGITNNLVRSNDGNNSLLNPLGFDEKDSKHLAQISAELKRLNRNIEKLILTKNK